MGLSKLYNTWAVQQPSAITDSFAAWEPSIVSDALKANCSYSNTSLGMTTSTFYADYYDKFVYQTYSDNYKVTKNTLGQDAKKTYYEMFYYVFEPETYKYTVLLSSGMNCCELAPIFGLAHFVDSLINSTESGMFALRNSTRFIILPLICPSSFDSNIKLYPNANGVRINKNFNYNKSWDIVNTDGLGSKGASPDSEMETKALKKWLSIYSGADLWIDCHADLETNTPNKLFETYSSDNAIKEKIITAQEKIKTFYLNKGYFTQSTPIIITNEIEGGVIYPKTTYAKAVHNIPSIMIEQWAKSTVYGASGSYQNEGNSIKNYVTMLRQYCLESLKETS